jgi:hypothetical protein
MADVARKDDELPSWRNRISRDRSTEGYGKTAILPTNFHATHRSRRDNEERESAPHS